MNIKRTLAISVFFALTNIAYADDFLDSKVSLFDKIINDPEAQNDILRDIAKDYKSDFVFIDPIENSVDPGVFTTHVSKRPRTISENEYPLANVQRICEDDFQAPPLSELEIDRKKYGPVKNAKIAYGAYKHHHWIYDSQEQIVWSADNLTVVKYKNPEIASSIIRKEIKKPNACNAEVRDNINRHNSVFIATGVIEADNYNDYKSYRHNIFGMPVNKVRAGTAKIVSKVSGIVEVLSPISAAAAEERYKSRSGRSFNGQTAIGLEVDVHRVRVRNKHHSRNNLNESDLEDVFSGL